MRADDAGPVDLECWCGVCGLEVGVCRCPACPKCSITGDPKCWEEHGLRSLVIAAPQLLAACEDIIQVVELLGEGKPIVIGKRVLDAARAAIKAATEGTPDARQG